MAKYRKFKQNKLWRDKAPGLMREMDSIVRVAPLDDAAFDKELRTKLLEEAQEVVAAQSQKQLMGELADLYEVIDSLCELHRINDDEIRQLQRKKRDERGGFGARQYVTIAEHQPGSYGERYCLADPEKYPEIVE